MRETRACCLSFSQHTNGIAQLGRAFSKTIVPPTQIIDKSMQSCIKNAGGSPCSLVAEQSRAEPSGAERSASPLRAPNLSCCTSLHQRREEALHRGFLWRTHIRVGIKSTMQKDPRQGSHIKNKKPGLWKAIGCETKMGVVRILIIFQDGSTFSHINQKVSARAFH